MTSNIGGNVNVYDDINAPLAIALNTSTYTQLLPANPQRIQYKVSHDSNKEIVIKETAAGSPDNLVRGFKVFKGVYVSEPSNIATGEISAIATVGTPSILVVEDA